MYVVMYSVKDDAGSFKKCSNVFSTQAEAEHHSYNMLKNLDAWGIENVYGIYELEKVQ